MGISQIFIGNSWEFMGNSWEIHDFWEFHGNSCVFFWGLHGVSMGFCMICPGNLCRNFMWDFMVIEDEFSITVVISRDINGHVLEYLGI